MMIDVHVATLWVMARSSSRDAVRLLGWVLVVLRWLFFFFSSRRRHTRLQGDWSSDVCSSDLAGGAGLPEGLGGDDADVGRSVVQVLPEVGRGGFDALPAAHQDAQRRPVADQIGRASCRERV